eukprot:gene15190-4537_t
MWDGQVGQVGQMGQMGQVGQVGQYSLTHSLTILTKDQ